MSKVNLRSSLEASDSDEACAIAMAACSLNSSDEFSSSSIDSPDGTPLLKYTFRCPLCLMALQDPLQAPCGHRFCKACILQSIRDDGPNCPLDNSSVSENELFPVNYFAKREDFLFMEKFSNQDYLAEVELTNLKSPTDGKN
ncbi:TNF receptor-associated factor 6-B-like isoform X2 [Pyxicephalus adspersus]|uniref:TNF receptor-associated factor 6-B-like isoform X2 n=1 Tax=Pyxicephalus adspersus TaxID=30357 RepID=UPI003B59DFE4